MITRRLLLSLGAVLTSGAAACAETGPVRSPSKPGGGPLPPIHFEASAVHEAPSALGRRYQVWVDLPPTYTGNGKPLPVVFVLDPHWALPVVRSARMLIGQRGRNIEDFILVGLTHDPVEGLNGQRRDYTPSDPRLNRASSAGEYTAPRYGEAERYRQYIETVVFPLIAANYRADMSRKTLIGHSYGGLFAFHVLFTSPTMFNAYVVGSPSLWFDDGLMFRVEQAWARSGRDLPARVHMVTGGYETIGTGPRFNKTNDLVADMQRMQRILASRRHPSLLITSEVAADEDHLTVFPDVVSRGLLTVLPGRATYTGG